MTELSIGPEAFPISVAITKILEILFKRLCGISFSLSKVASSMSGRTGIETKGAATPITINPKNIILADFSIPRVGDVPISNIETESIRSPIKITAGLLSFADNQNIKGQSIK